MYELNKNKNKIKYNKNSFNVSTQKYAIKIKLNIKITGDAWTGEQPEIVVITEARVLSKLQQMAKQIREQLGNWIPCWRDQLEQ